jgi:magnesium transporter
MLSLSSLSRSASRSRKKVGLPPGAVVFTGRAKTEPVSISIMNYAADRLTERDDVSVDDALRQRDAAGPSWVNVTGVHDVEIVQTLGEHFGLHPLVQEDVAHTSQRPKLEVYDDHVYVVLKMLTLAEPDEAETPDGDTPAPQLRVEQVSLVVGEEWLLCFQEDAGDVFDPVRERIRSGRGRIRTRSTDYLAYALVDVIIDHYFVVLEHLGDRIEALEDEVLDDPDQRTQEKINRVRRDLVTMRRMTWPVRELLSQMDRLESDVWDEATRPFVRDAYDHAVQVLDLVESLRDVVGGLTDLYMTSLSNRMNEIMKVLTIMGSIFIPLTFVAGIYGMNFDYMPELQVWWAYPLVWTVMLTTAAALLVFFWKRDWI